MKKMFSVFAFLSVFTFTAFCNGAEPALTKKRVLSDIESIHNIFEVKYAPLTWKEEFCKWNLDSSIADAKKRVMQGNTTSLKECQGIIRDFFNSTQDYHVGVRFFSTESATLPFLVKGAKGRYFISYIDRDNASFLDFPFDEGDEIIKFDGRPIHEAIQKLRLEEFGSNVSETDQALAEMYLTHRRGDLGSKVPSGKVTIVAKKKKTAKEVTTTLQWAYTPEKIKDFSKLNMAIKATKEDWKNDWQTALKKSQFFDKMMVAHFWDRSFVGSAMGINKQALGARTSYVPALGPKIWKTSSDSIFDAYIFKSPSGSNIGYIRIPHYIGDEEEVEEFGMIMNVFEAKCDALVIDQINNPGGSVFYLYGLVSTLTDKPLATPKHHIALTQEEVYTAAQLLQLLEQIKGDEMAREVFGETVGGYPVDYEFVSLTMQFCRFLIEEWENGKLQTDPTFLFGVDEIKPHRKYSFTKPILLLINSLDFSGGDFFPAIMQDTERATLFGTRTSGAGGYVLGSTFPNHSGIKGFSLTGSLAKRLNKKPIENLGVTPHISYELSATDLQENYKEYVEQILIAVERLIETP